MLSERAERYLVTTFEIVEEKGYVRVGNIAEAMDVTPASVVGMMEKLHGIGLVDYRKRDGVILTQEGEEKGKAIKYGGYAIKSFLEILGIPDAAESDVCAMKELNPATINGIGKLVGFVSADDKLCRGFEKYCERGAGALKRDRWRD